MNNLELAQVFEDIADLLSIQGESVYKVIAYRKAAEGLRSLGQDVHALWEQSELESIPGVGKAIAAKIDELLRTGELEYLQKLTMDVPRGLVEVVRVPDVGPKKAALFWKELGIDSVAKLEAAAKQGNLRDLPGLGERSEARILESIEAQRRRQSGRVSIGRALPAAELFLTRLLELQSVEAAEAAGSLRRMRETVGDLDLVAATGAPAKVAEAFLSFPEIGRVRGSGETKLSVELNDGLRVQLWLHAPERYGSALQYATGSQGHNVALRELALSKGLSLSEHGFKRDDRGEILCATEEEVYAALGLPWIAPELREDRGELQAALKDALPQLVEEGDIQGELHAHSDWSDGAVTILEMAEGAKAAGLSYLVITDHSQSLGVANGLTPERLREQKQAIQEAQQALGKRFRLLQGAEVEILSDGRLDYPDDVLEELDFVIASLHTSLRQKREKVTERLLRAIRNPNVDMIGHPTGRLIGSRDPADLDMERVIAAAAEHQVALEINANPERLDLKDAHARLAVEAGCLLAIDTDAHHPDHLALRRFGIGTARRGWVEAGSVLNARPAGGFLDWIGSRS